MDSTNTNKNTRKVEQCILFFLKNRDQGLEEEDRTAVSHIHKNLHLTSDTKHSIKEKKKAVCPADIRYLAQHTGMLSMTEHTASTHVAPGSGREH